MRAPEPAIDTPIEDAVPVRRAGISRQDLLAAALRLVGPHRSLSSLSLREVAREAGIAPNPFTASSATWTNWPWP